MKAQQTQSYTIPLHDIKPLVDVEDYSLYYFLATSAFVLLLTCSLIYLAYKWYKKRKTFNIRRLHVELINELDLSDTKATAYAITSYGLTFKNDSDRHQEMYENITSRLEEYKYKKAVESFDEEVLGYIEVYKGMIDV
ncbi:hypothetical protein N9A28_07385 [Sulfurimonas sp.]|nr:hypothetical protein [Sulfurimonas sp.]